MQLDLSSNQLCGINYFGQGTYTAEGITAIAEALKVTGSLTELNLEGNKIGNEGAAAIAKGLSANGSLTKLDLEYNQLDESAKAALRAAARPALKLDL